MAREDFTDAFYGEKGLEFAHGHTYANNPLSSAAAIAVIDEMQEQGLPQKARERGKYLFIYYLYSTISFMAPKDTGFLG